MPTSVNVDNFVRAESDLMFSRLAADAGGVGKWVHYREPAPIDHQPIVRQNRDTLYSAAIVDLAAPATLTVPDTAARYVSVMIVNQDHYIPTIIHDAGTYDLDAEALGSRYVLLGVRMLVDPADPNDVATVNSLQDALHICTTTNDPFPVPDYDTTTHTATRAALLELARGLPDFRHAFGREGEVDPVRRLVCSASGWGGLPEYEAHYVNVDPGLPVGDYRIRMADVPVDAFWSISLYNADGYFEANPLGVNNLNSITSTTDPDGATTVNFGAQADGRNNFLPIMNGWNFLIRMYRPHSTVIDGTWTPPPVEAID